jgi:hypothetical protein
MCTRMVLTLPSPQPDTAGSILAFKKQVEQFETVIIYDLTALLFISLTKYLFYFCQPPPLYRFFIKKTDPSTKTFQIQSVLLEQRVAIKFVY